MAGPTEAELITMLKKARSIPGHFGKGESRFLYGLARRRGNLVEIGCWQGRTTIIMAMAASKWGAHLTTVDPFGRKRMAPQYRKLKHSPENWRANLQKVGLEAPDLLHMTSDKAAEVYDRPLHLLFIDGNHTKTQVARDLANWTPKMVINSYLILHDMFFPGIRGVASAVAEWWDGRSWRMIDIVQSTIAFRRVS